MTANTVVNQKVFHFFKVMVDFPENNGNDASQQLASLSTSNRDVFAIKCKGEELVIWSNSGHHSSSHLVIGLAACLVE